MVEIVKSEIKYLKKLSINMAYILYSQILYKTYTKVLACQ